MKKVIYPPYQGDEPSKAYLADEYFTPYEGEINVDGLRALRAQQAQFLDKPSTRHWNDPVEAVKSRSGDPMNFRGDMIRFGESGILSPEEDEALQGALKSFMPWRKGPLSYYGTDIDAEWRSNLKWDRLLPHLPDMKNKKVCDIGCNNLYYMYRMLEHDPWFILGIDPVVRYYFHHKLNRKFCQDPRINFDMIGVDDLALFPKFFDVVFFMGILYHRRNPVQTLDILASSMKRGGTLIVECQGIPGDEPTCLFPEGRYMKAPGYWFLPTAPALVNMLKRSGFHNIEVFEDFKLEFNEQRQTAWAQYESLEDFLDPNDHSKTIEGYPAPTRIYVRADKK